MALVHCPKCESSNIIPSKIKGLICIDCMNYFDE